MDNSTWTQILQAATPAIGIVLTAIALWLARKLGTNLDAQKTQAAIEAAVGYIEQTMESAPNGKKLQAVKDRLTQQGIPWTVAAIEAAVAKLPATKP
jgi:F0F1-type ATP synthase membrane subunit a